MLQLLDQSEGGEQVCYLLEHVAEIWSLLLFFPPSHDRPTGRRRRRPLMGFSTKRSSTRRGHSSIASSLWIRSVPDTGSVAHSSVASEHHDLISIGDRQ
jgi:hypothetical protein